MVRASVGHSASGITTHRSRTAVAFALALLRGAPRASADPSDELAGTRGVCERGPAMAVAAALRQRGEAAVIAAGGVANPELVVEHQQGLSGAEDRETVVGVAVPLGLGGRRGLLEEAAQSHREAARAEATGTLFEAALAYRHDYAAVSVAEARLAVLRAQQQALDGFATRIEGLAKGGELGAFDLLRQRTEARTHRRLLERGEAEAAAARARLLAWRDDGVLPLGSSLDALAGGPDLLRRATPAEAPSPEERALRATARASAAEGGAAERRWVSDVAVFVGYRGTVAGTAAMGHGVSLGLTVPLPLFDRGQREAARADAERAAAETSAERVRRENAADAQAATARLLALEASGEELARAESDAAALEDAATALYAAGELSIVEVLDAFRAAEQARLARVDSAEAVVMARLAWMRARGTLVDAALDQACGLAPKDTR